MKPVFADASYYFALLNNDDEFHRAALAATGKIPPTMVTTAWILAEVADGMCRVRHRQLVADFIRDLRADDRVTVVPPTLELFDRGFDLYCRRPDKDWSLTDCISFVVMQERGLTDALTADPHFGQAGLNVLLT